MWLPRVKIAPIGANAVEITIEVEDHMGSDAARWPLAGV
jgi:hypothetical protein